MCCSSFVIPNCDYHLLTAHFCHLSLFRYFNNTVDAALHSQGPYLKKIFTYDNMCVNNAAPLNPQFFTAMVKDPPYTHIFEWQETIESQS